MTQETGLLPRRVIGHGLHTCAWAATAYCRTPPGEIEAKPHELACLPADTSVSSMLICRCWEKQEAMLSQREKKKKEERRLARSSWTSSAENATDLIDPWRLERWASAV